MPAPTDHASGFQRNFPIPLRKLRAVVGMLPGLRLFFLQLPPASFLLPFVPLFLFVSHRHPRP